MKATCISCGRTFEASEMYVKAVQAGKVESLCSSCSGDYDDEDDGRDSYISDTRGEDR